MTCLCLQLFCVFAFTLNLCTAFLTVNKSCTVVGDGNGASETGTCFHVSNETLTWQDAHRFCHLNQGYLMNSVHELSSYFDPSVLKLDEKGITSLWSGQHVKNQRLLADNFPTVQRIGTFTNFTLNTIPGSSLCVLQVYNGASKVRLTKRQAQIVINGTQWEASYTKMLAPCDEKHFFVCMFQVKFDFTKGYILNQGSTATIRIYNLPVDFYTSVENVTFNEIDASCKRTLEGGTPFRVISDIERKMLISYWNASLYLGYINDTTELFWLDAGEYHGCSAVAVASFNFVHQVYTPLPCGTRLRALCQLNKLYNVSETPPPEWKITANRSGVVVIDNEIQAPSRLVRQFGSVTNNVSVECVTTIGPLQAVTLYRNGIPFMSQDGMPHTVGHYLNLTVQGVSDIDLNQYFHCEVNNLKNASTLQSDFVFLRLTDYEIYSLHIDLAPNEKAERLALLMLEASLLNKWAPQTFDASGRNLSLNSTIAPPAIRSLSNGSSLVDLQISLDSVVRSLQDWRIKPMLFTISPNDDRKSLVAYFYQSVSETHTIDDMNQTVFELASENITELFLKSPDELPQFNVTSVQVRSIDWCWAVTMSDNITSDQYDLPKSTMGTNWRSQNLCARDSQPLVTVKCEGDKIIGLYWSQLHVNALCDYSANKSGRTNATQDLQALAQGSINSSNSEAIVNDTMQTLQGMNLSRVIPEDVRYLADIFQKLSNISVKTRATVQGMLDVAAFMRNFPGPVLRDAQSLGNATNRILKSLDLSGGQVEIGPDEKFRRIISGGLGLEVWNLSRINDDTLVVGIKLLSENLTSENLLTLNKTNQVDYGQTEVAILLQTDLIKDTVRNYTGSNIRLAMNIYSDTTLFNTSVLETSISKPSLNSRIIAAQLLVDDQPITNLSSSAVQIVFLPIKKAPIHLRPNLTTCAFWDFEAESGAGGWSSQGCVYNQTIDGTDVCVCDHLTNFAVLMSFYEQESLNNEHALAMTIISIVGLSLSIVGLSATILSFLLITRLRRGQHQQTLFQLCLALLMSWIVFLSGVTQTSSHAGCIVVAVLLHYLILSSFMWMLMEALLQYLLFVKVMNTYVTHYMLKTSIPAWGLPVIPVVIVLSIDPDLYDGGELYCWMSLPAFYYSFVIPVGLIVLTNIVVYIMVVVSLCRREDMTQHSSRIQNQNVVNIRASFVCFFVLGLSWIFGFLALGDARVVFQYIFCISASLQGFVIFAMMTARDKNVRAFWLSKLSMICFHFPYRTKDGKDTAREKRIATKSAARKLGAFYSDKSESNDLSLDSTTSTVLSNTSQRQLQQQTYSSQYHTTEAVTAENIQSSVTHQTKSDSSKPTVFNNTPQRHRQQKKTYISSNKPQRQ
ncbi:unnamed protein product [Lymnaea stagnalis]|uniref:Uncharacterized protein n=1 Tax=Lymnaea stagnalis TaxID=6523 RepID=A0AAV2HDA7_LYMST